MTSPFWRTQLGQCPFFDPAKAFTNSAELLSGLFKMLAFTTAIFLSDFF